MYVPPLEVRHVETLDRFQGKPESARSPFGATALCSGLVNIGKSACFSKFARPNYRKRKLSRMIKRLQKGPRVQISGRMKHRHNFNRMCDLVPTSAQARNPR